MTLQQIEKIKAMQFMPKFGDTVTNDERQHLDGFLKSVVETDIVNDDTLGKKCVICDEYYSLSDKDSNDFTCSSECQDRLALDVSDNIDSELLLALYIRFAK